MDNNEHDLGEILPGYIVKWTKEPGYFWMTVEAIEGDQALCTFRVLNTPMDSDERPAALVPKQDYFPIDELEVQRGH